MYEKEYIQLIKTISKEQTKRKKKKRYNNAYNIAIFLFIALADKGYIGDYMVTVSARFKIHRKQQARLIANRLGS